MSKKALKRAIIIAWIFLGVSLIIKIFGGSWFNVAFSTQPMLRADAFLERHYWAQVIAFSVTTYAGFNLYYLAICQKRNFGKFLHIALIPYFVIVSIVKVLLFSIGATNWGLLLDAVSLIIIPIILLGKPKKKHLRVIIALGLYLIFAVISLVAKSVPIGPAIIVSVLTEIILAIDLYVMLLLFYLYVLYHTKEKVNNEQSICNIFQSDRGCKRVGEHA